MVLLKTNVLNVDCWYINQRLSQDQALETNQNQILRANKGKIFFWFCWLFGGFWSILRKLVLILDALIFVLVLSSLVRVLTTPLISINPPNKFFGKDKMTQNASNK